MLHSLKYIAAYLIVIFAASTLASAQYVVQTLKSFGIPDVSGGTSLAPLALDAQGWLYGTTTIGGSNGFGGIFKIAQDGTGYRVIYSFGGLDGRKPQAALMVGSDGVLYGSTSEGGSNTTGTLFKLNRDGTAFSVLHHVSGPESDWGSPRATLCQGTDGMLYGTTIYGGTNNGGTVFRISTNGTGHSILHHFDGADGQEPFGRLLHGLNGALYGTTYRGGVSNVGTIFTISTDGSGYSVLYGFTKGRNYQTQVYNGYNPAGGLVQGSDGTLYGTTVSGGGWSKNGRGTVFKIDPDGGGYAVLLSFNATYTQGAGPRCELLLADDGTLYGTAIGALSTGFAGSVFAVQTDGSNPRSLHEFTTSANDGSFPIGALAQDQSGMLFGIASQGGSNGVGTIFGVLPNGTAFQTLHNFSPTGGDPQEPRGKLVQDTNGVIYGVTSAGGTNGCGTIFRINPNGFDYSILRTLSGLDGKNPRALMLSPDGLLYGTTASGGISNCGIVFKASRDASFYTVLHNFDGLGGSDPEAGVMLATNGVLYGTTYGGGTGFFGSSDGTIYSLNTDGTGFAKLHDFNHGSGIDGYEPTAGFVQGTDGLLYSGTRQSSYPYQPGTVYKINLDGSGFTVLKLFFDAGGFPAGPGSDLLQASDQAFYGATVQGVMFKINSDGNNYTELHTLEGNGWAYRPTYLALDYDGTFYGTESAGGPNYAGTIFKMKPDGSEFSVIHNFGATERDGSSPVALMHGSDGLWYGTTAAGGNMGYGTVFRMVPLPQITSFEPGPSGTARMSISTVSNLAYQVDVSTNLLNWIAVSNFTATASQKSIVDQSTANSLQRFYRAAWVP